MKKFLKNLFCSHGYIRITEWHKIKTLWGDLEKMALFQCQNCGKYKSKKIIDKYHDQ